MGQCVRKAGRELPRKLLGSPFNAQLPQRGEPARRPGRKTKQLAKERSVQRLEGQDTVMEQSLLREVLRGASEDPIPVFQHRTPGAQQAVFGVGARRVRPSDRHLSVPEEPDDTLTEPGIRADEVSTHARVGTRQHDRPGEVSRGVEEARTSRGTLDRRDPLFR